MVYRLIFLFVAEDRDLLLLPVTPDEVQRRYIDYYSVRRLRDMAETLRGGPHADLYRGLCQIFALLRDGYSLLGLPALGSFLFSERATPDLDQADQANSALLETIRALAFTIEGKVRRPVDYRNLGAEELAAPPTQRRRRDLCPRRRRRIRAQDHRQLLHPLLAHPQPARHCPRTHRRGPSGPIPNP